MATNRKASLVKGIFLAVTFWAVLILIFSPVFGQGRNGLQYADDLFNRLSKGSSHFIPNLSAMNEKFKGRAFSLGLKEDKTDADARIVLGKNGVTVEKIDGKLTVSGDLGAMLAAVLRDSEDMYQNRGEKLTALYDIEHKTAMKAWWSALKRMDGKLKLDGKLEEAGIISEVMKKAVEPAYNYYGIAAEKVADKAVLMTSTLVFYVIYTLWWGFAIFYIFDGIGLSMTKKGFKKEV
jgi:hypothetical protein